MRAWIKRLGAVLVAVLCIGSAQATVTYVYSDPQGTPLAEADASGNITATFDYRPYGVQALGTPKDGPGYTGHVNDVDSGFVYMQARYYDPSVGRFLSVDPVNVQAANIYTTNRYSYVNDNPVMNIDPTGKKVYVDISRKRYTDKSVISTIKVSSDKTSKSFTGYALENSKAGDEHDKKPIPQGSYKGHTREDGKKGWRIELNHVKGYAHIEIHVGNFPKNVKGCFAAGTSAPGKNFVSHSKEAMKSIESVVKADGGRDITIHVSGSPTQP